MAAPEPNPPRRTLQDYLTTPLEGEATTLNLGGGAGDRRVTLELKKVAKDEPEKARSPGRAHVFYEPASFAAYLAKNLTSDTVVWADPVAETFHAVLDDKASRGFETITMEPQTHPLWAPWKSLLDRRTVKIEDFARHLSENRRTIAMPEGRTLSYIFGQVKAAVSVEVHRGRGKDAVNGIVVRSKIEGATPGKPDLVEIPEEIVLHVALYVQSPQREIGLDLLVDATPDGCVTVTVTAGTLAEARVAAFEEMVEAVEKGIGGRAVVGYGHPSTEDWSTLA